MAERRTWVKQIMSQYELSERQACHIMEISRSVYRYQAKKKDDSQLIQGLKELAAAHPRWGFWKMYQRLRNQGKKYNHKRVYRVYKAEKLHLRIKPKKRLSSRNPQPLKQPERPNEVWSFDFMSDSLASGRSFRTLNIIDDFNREGLWIEIDTGLPSTRVIRVLEYLADCRGLPHYLRSDNGPEFIAKALADWAQAHQITLDFIEPGKPAQNAYIERFNRSYREEVLDMYLFSSLNQVRSQTETWLHTYNCIRPHDALDGMPPFAYLQRYFQKQKNGKNNDKDNYLT